MEEREVTREIDFYEEFSPSVSFHSSCVSSLPPHSLLFPTQTATYKKNSTFIFVLPLKFHRDTVMEGRQEGRKRASIFFPSGEVTVVLSCNRHSFAKHTWKKAFREINSNPTLIGKTRYITAITSEIDKF